MKKEREKYFVIGFRRYKTAEEYKNKIVGHNHRTRHYIKNPHSNIDWERTKDNIVLTQLQFKSLDELKQYAKNNLSKGKRNLKKGAAWGFEMIVDCTPREEWSEEDYIRYLKEAEAWLRRRFKGLKVISSVIHLDEGKPHLHIVFSYFNEVEGAWYQRKLKEIGVDRLSRLLDDFEKDIGKKYGFSRGKGKELDKPLKRELAKKVKEVEIKEGIFKTQRKKVIFIPDAAAAIKNLDKKYKQALYENEHLKTELTKVKQENKKLAEKVLKSDNRIQQLEKENAQYKKAAEKFIDAVAKIKNLEKELAAWKNAAIAERERRLNTKIPEKLREKTLDRIKADNNIGM